VFIPQSAWDPFRLLEKTSRPAGTTVTVTGVVTTRLGVPGGVPELLAGKGEPGQQTT
jgi:hypothetical protein